MMPLPYPNGPPDDNVCAWGALIRILYEDAALVVVNKPPGFTSLPSDNDGGQSVLSQVEKYLRGREASKWPVPQRLLPLHRLDKDTSGVLMFCKKKDAVDAVTRQFRCLIAAAAA